MRSFFLACSQSEWLRASAPRHRFVRRAVSRFMPGEKLDDALDAAARLRQTSIGALLTYLGENVTDRAEAERVTKHYLEALDRVRERQLGAELSVKLTQLGLDLDPEFCYANLERIINHAGENSTVWIDMESSAYTDSTLNVYRRVRRAHRNAGVCLQAYLYRTADDLASLLPLAPAIRLVKGAYKEPLDRAFPKKSDVDRNYFALAQQLLSADTRAAGLRPAIATHDRRLISRIADYALSHGVGKQGLEFQMLYGIQRAQQLRLAQGGWRSTVLISYGAQWFPWYMRRLAERPANAWFVVRSLVAA